MSEKCRFCCKSRKSNDPENLVKVDLWTSLLLRWLSTPLRASVIDFGQNDMVPHVATHKTHQRLQEFSFATPKRLLQQYLPQAEILGGGRTASRGIIAGISDPIKGLPTLSSLPIG
jgi:hypothetical protein